MLLDYQVFFTRVLYCQRFIRRIESETFIFDAIEEIISPKRQQNSNVHMFVADFSVTSKDYFLLNVERVS